MKVTKNKKRFAEWLALPEALRHPETLDGLANAMNVRPATLSRWERDGEFQGLVSEMACERLDRVIPDVIQAIIDMAVKGDFRFVKLVLDLTGNDQVRTTGGQEEPTISFEQFSAVIRQVEEWKRERFGG